MDVKKIAGAGLRVFDGSIDSRCKILACSEHLAEAEQIGRILHCEFNISCDVAFFLRPSPVPNTEEPSNVCRRVDAQGFDPYTIEIIIWPGRLATPFGKPLVGQAIDRFIVLAGRSLNNSNIYRIIRHEIGHFFGLCEHLMCVMSPYWVDDHSYCGECKAKLSSIGVIWRDSTLEHPQSARE